VLAPLSGGVNNLFMVTMMFASYVAAGGYGIAVATAGLIITSSRIFDAITDPLIALITDRFNTRFGRLRIVSGIGLAIMSLSVFAMFFWGIGQGIVFFTAIYMIYIIGYTIYGVSTLNQAAPILTTDPVQRSSLFRFNAIYSLLFSTLVGSVYLSMVLAPKYGGLKIAAFQEMAVMAVIVGIVFWFFYAIAISSVDKPESFVNRQDKKAKVGFKDMLAILKSNRALQMYMLAAISDKLALMASSQSAVTTLIMGVIIGNYTFNGILGFINIVPTIALIFLSTRLMGKASAKTAVLRWSMICVVLSVVYVLFMVIVDPKQISVAVVPTVLFVIINACNTGCRQATSAVTMAMIPDITDYEMYRSGNFMPSTVTACYSLMDKLISSFAATIVGFCLAAIGYTTVMPQPGDQSSPAIFWMAMFLSQGIPILGWMCTFIAMRFYPLDKEKMAEVQRCNHEARQAQMPQA
jgi:Na+/melibiose symporter-like transporter